MCEFPKSRTNSYPKNKWRWESQLLKYLWLIASSVAIILSLWFIKPTFAWNNEWRHYKLKNKKLGYYLFDDKFSMNIELLLMIQSKDYSCFG